MYIPRHPTPGRRIAYDSSFAASALVAGALFGGSPDVIVAMCSPLQAGATAALLGYVRRAPFIFHLQDLLPEGAVALGMLRNPVAIKVAEALARAIYARADRISAIGGGFLEALTRKGVPQDEARLPPQLGGYRVDPAPTWDECLSCPVWGWRT